MPPCLICFRPPLFCGVRSALRVRIPGRALSTTAADDVASIKTRQVPAPGSGNIRILLLNRAQNKNALSRELLDDLSTKIESIAAERGNGPTRALVLASNVDSAFCAGADLKERVTMSQDEFAFPGSFDKRKLHTC